MCHHLCHHKHYIQINLYFMYVPLHARCEMYTIFGTIHLAGGRMRVPWDNNTICWEWVSLRFYTNRVQEGKWGWYKILCGEVLLQLIQKLLWFRVIEVVWSLNCSWIRLQSCHCILGPFITFREDRRGPLKGGIESRGKLVMNVIDLWIDSSSHSDIYQY